MHDIMGTVFDIKRFAIHDGGGIRSTIFVKGCPLRCPWCHNPEGLNKKIEIIRRPTLCISCKICQSICSEGAIHSIDSEICIDPGKCVRCYKCTENCPSLALHANGRLMSAGEAVNELLKDIEFFKESGGGITLSGGEALLQSDFSFAVALLAKQSGVHTAIESCLYADRSVVYNFMDVIDKFIVDIKIFDETVHKKITGKSNVCILNNFEMLAENDMDILVRVPLIPGYTDSDANLVSIANYVSKVSSGTKIELLNYNPFAAGKYFGNEGGLKDIKPLSIAEFNRKKQIVHDITDNLVCT